MAGPGFGIGMSGGPSLGPPAQSYGGGGGFAPIQGSLPFTNPGNSYASAYNSSLAMNRQNYSNIMSGYNQTMQSQQSAQQGITAGYGQLTGDVMGLIAGTDASQRQAISDQYQANRGQASQNLINRGLGNTTVQSSIDRGLQYDRSKAEINLSNQFAQLNAQYRTQLGLSGLDYRNQANMQNTALANQQLQFMNSVNAGYPNAAAYAALAAQKGAVKAGGLGGPGALGGGTTTYDKKPTPAATPSAGNWGGASYGYMAPSYGYGQGGGGYSPSEIYPSQDAMAGWDLPGASEGYLEGTGENNPGYSAAGGDFGGDGFPTDLSSYDTNSMW